VDSTSFDMFVFAKCVANFWDLLKTAAEQQVCPFCFDPFDSTITIKYTINSLFQSSSFTIYHVVRIWCQDL
jgi:hypothetical protein